MANINNIINSKKKEYITYQGERIEVPKLGSSKLKMLMFDEEDREKMTDSILDISRYVLEHNFPNMTDEQFDKIPLDLINDIQKKIVEIHDLNVDV